MTEPRWLSRQLVDLIQADVIRVHGGRPGIRDHGMIESALDGARNRWVDEEGVDLAELAAAYGYGLVSNHGYVDGNKRVALMATFTFLGLNDFDLEAAEVEVTVVIQDLAASELGEAQFAAWIRQHLVPVE